MTRGIKFAGLLNHLVPYRLLDLLVVIAPLLHLNPNKSVTYHHIINT